MRVYFTLKNDFGIKSKASCVTRANLTKGHVCFISSRLMCVGTRCVPSVATRVVAKIYRPFSSPFFSSKDNLRF